MLEKCGKVFEVYPAPEFLQQAVAEMGMPPLRLPG